MLLFAEQHTPRLQHMADWLGRYLFGQPMPVVTDLRTAATTPLLINYSRQALPLPCFQLPPHSLLFERTIEQQQIHICQATDYPYFFETGGAFAFDVLAASFYLLQRYEEYLPHTRDLYQRYAHTNSLAFRCHFLHLPLVDHWMQALKKALLQQFPDLVFAPRPFRFLPTYDVDIAYSYLSKGWRRNTGGLCRSLLSGHWGTVRQRLAVLSGRAPDPFDVFEELDHLHRQYGLYPVYFWLLAQQQQGIDKNTHPDQKRYRRLISGLAAQYPAGIHLSGAASRSLPHMQAEQAILATLTGRPIQANRMHYLLFHLPDTYRRLAASPLHLSREFSMGYGSINGFRASTCTPYYWYDLPRETSTGLQVFPFCYMEANSIFEQRDTPEAALAEMKQYLHLIRETGGCYITIFHNHLIGHSAAGRRWMQVYRQFLATLAEQQLLSVPTNPSFLWPDTSF